MKFKSILFCALLLSFYNTIAQETGEKEVGAWYMYAGTHQVSEKWSIKTVMQLRTYEVTNNFNFLFFQGGGNYSLNKNISAGLNYGFLVWDRSFGDNDNPNTIEHRINEQIYLKNKSGKFSLVNRLSFDHRFIDNKSSYETQHRIRYRFHVKHPINETLFISVFDEIMYNLDGFKFQQNRLYGAMGFKLSDNINLELGYLKWSFKSRAFDRLQIGVSVKTDWRKKSLNPNI